MSTAATTFIRSLAVEVKSAMATGYTLDDIGIILGVETEGACSFGEPWQSPGLCDEAFAALCAEVEATLPLVRADPRIIAAHRQAASDCIDEQRAEQRAFCPH